MISRESLNTCDIYGADNNWGELNMEDGEDMP